MATVKKGSRRKRAINVETEMTQARFKMSCGCIRTIPWSRAPFFVACLHQPPNLVNGAVIKGHRSAETAAFGSKVPSDRKKTIKYLFEELLCVCLCVCALLSLLWQDLFNKTWIRNGGAILQSLSATTNRLDEKLHWTETDHNYSREETCWFSMQNLFFCVTIFDFNDCAPVQILEIVLKD